MSEQARPGGSSARVGRARRAARLAAALAFAALPSAAEPLRILTWNLWHGTVRTERAEKLVFPRESESHRRSRLAYQLELLASERPDLLLLQEVSRLPRTARDLASALGHREIHKVDSCGVRLFGFGVPRGLESGLAILARPELGLRRLAGVRLSGGASFCTDWLGLQLEEGRYALLAQITVEGLGRLLVVDTHLHNQPWWSADLRRALEERVAAGELPARHLERMEKAVRRGEERKLREIAELLETIGRYRRADPGLAGVVLGGDLNLVPGSAGHERLVAAGLTDVVPVAGPLLGGLQRSATYDATRNPLAARVGELSAAGLPGLEQPELLRLARGLRAASPRRIDYVFVSAELAGRIGRATLFGTHPGDAWVGAGASGESFRLMASDHFGVLVELER